MNRSESSIQSLPIDLLAGVLQHLKQKERLLLGALVCKTWRLAAGLATCRSGVIYAENSNHGLESLSVWLSSNHSASSLQCICVREAIHRTGSKAVLQLPAGKLTCLTALWLPYCHLEVAAPDGTALPVAHATTTAVAATQLTSLAALTALSSLRLSSAVLDINELGSCTGLQHLDLSNVYHKTAGDKSSPLDRSFSPRLAAAMLQLTQLTYLGLHYYASSGFSNDISESIQQEGNSTSSSTTAACLSSLQHLQALWLKSTSCTAVNLRQLPSTLTSLELEFPYSSYRSTLPQAQHMTHLQHLSISRASITDPMLLSQAVSLRDLCLDGCSFHTIDVIDGLLVALQQLEQLQHLSIQNSSVYWLHNEELGRLEPQSFAALTASSQLESLDVCGFCIPSGADIHMFGVAGALLVP